MELPVEYADFGAGFPKAVSVGDRRFYERKVAVRGHFETLCGVREQQLLMIGTPKPSSKGV